MKHIVHGRCRSGKRWFWAAFELYPTDTNHHCDDPMCLGGAHEYGWAGTEDAALKAMTESVTRLGGEVKYYPGLPPGNAGWASDALKRINAVKRASRPSSATGTKPIKYLYSSSGEAFRITKRTRKRIYYMRAGELLYGPRIGCVNGEILDRDGVVQNHSRHWSSVEFELFAAPPPDYRKEDAAARTVRIKDLYRAMIAAHPDRGGTHEQFLEARRNYERAQETALR